MGVMAYGVAWYGWLLYSSAGRSRVCSGCLIGYEAPVEAWLCRSFVFCAPWLTGAGWSSYDAQIELICFIGCFCASPVQIQG